MSKPIIHVPLDQDEIVELCDALKESIFNTREYGDVARVPQMERLRERLQEAYGELSEESNSSN